MSDKDAVVDGVIQEVAPEVKVVAREARTATLAQVIADDPVSKRRGYQLVVDEEKKTISRSYSFLTESEKPAFRWKVDLANGECLGNGGSFPGKSVIMKDGYNQAIAILESALAEIDALMDSSGLML